MAGPQHAFPQPVKEILFLGGQRVRTGGFDLDPDAFELPRLIGRQRGCSGRRARLSNRRRRVGCAEIEKINQCASESTTKVGPMTDRQPTATTLCDETPKVEANEGENTGKRRHRHDAEEQDPVARKMEGVGEQKSTDRARSAEGWDVVPTHDERGQRAVTDRRHDRSRQVDEDKDPGPPQVFEDRPEAPQNEHIERQVPEFVVGKGSRDQCPNPEVFDVKGADEKVFGHQRKQVGRIGRRLPGDKDKYVEADDDRDRRRSRPFRTGGRSCWHIESRLVWSVHRRRIMAEPHEGFRGSLEESFGGPLLRRSRCISLVATTLMVAAVSFASELGDRLDRELKGSWGVLEVEVYSACGGTYSDNELGTAGVASKAQNRFAAGELVKIDNVKVKRQRVDLLLTLDAPLRVSRMDGPFELFDQHSCRVQLMVFVAREQVKTSDLEGLLTEVKKHITLYSSREEAEISDNWNGREMEPLPDDYEDTLHRNAIWKAEQTNAAVRGGIDHALSAAAEVIEDLDDDADYLAGFGEGAEKMGEFTVTSCDSLLSVSFTSYRESAPSENSRSWKDGWIDGQKLVFHVLVANRLRSCLLPVPSPPLP